MKDIGVGLLSALAGSAIGIGIVFSRSYCFSPNPRLKLSCFVPILGFAFVEALALFSLILAFLIIFS
jgi:F0F1-type ATP synthase membrane subunit c/vacuolar-type H+-ATPase subunit K